MKKIKSILSKLEKLDSIDRYDIIRGIMIFLMVVLSLRLGYLTIIKGNYYKEIAINKRIREVSVSAPRGNIYDRNGKILAGTKAVYTAALYKDDLNKMKSKEKNNKLLTLSHILEADGSSFADNYPVALNYFAYKTEKEYFSEEKSPEDKVVDIVIGNKLMPEIVRAKYSEDNNGQKYSYHISDRVINALKFKGIEIPFTSDYGQDNLKFRTDQSSKEFFTNYKVSKDTDPFTMLANFTMSDKSVIRKVLEHPVGRKLVYDILVSKNLQGNIVMKDFALVEQENFLITKAKLSKSYQGITLESNAIDDFTNIVSTSTIKQLIENVSFGSNNEITVPVKYAIDLLKSKGIPVNITYRIDETDKKNTKVVVEYTQDSNKELTTAEDFLILTLKNNNLIKDFVTNENVKSIAQTINTQNNISPGISIKDWEYTSKKGLRDLFERYKLDKDGKGVTPEKVFQTILEKNKITDISKYRAYNLLALTDRIEKQGDQRYKPINLSYNLSEKTVATIKESFGNDTGIEVNTEPIRDYPNGELGFHVLGYLGKIATNSEVDQYVNKNRYDKNTLIGKTGIEESEESVLKGKDGVKIVQVDNRGNRTETVSETKAEPGNNVFLSIDMDIQKATENALAETLRSLQTDNVYKSIWGNKNMIRSSSGKSYVNATSASAVVTDVKTGKVLAMANLPQANPNLFATGISQSDWAGLFPENEKDPLAPRPLFNIAMQSAIQPGSIFKLDSALAALEKGMDPNMTIKCNGYIDMGDRTFGCWIWNTVRGTHGYENVMDALRDSCNYYFYSLVLGENRGNGKKLPIKLEIEDIINTSKKLGLGEKTGIEIRIPQENKGILPDPQIKMANTKALYKAYIEGNAKNFIKNGTKMTDKQLNDKIAIMSGWIEEKSPLTRTEVIKRLDEMGFDTEKKDETKKQTFGDTIKFDYLNQVSWTIADSLNVVIGQGQNAYTPIQMANYMATFANDGYKYKISVIDSVKNADNSKVLFENKPQGERIVLNDYRNLEYIRKGLNMAANNGADRKVFGTLPIQIGVKTGTAQRAGNNPVTGKPYDEYAWMIAFAPYDNPQIAVSTVIFQGGTSGNAGPMTRDIIAAALKLKPENKNEVDKVDSNDSEPRE